MESGVCYLKAYSSSTGPILASGIDSMQNQHQHDNTVFHVIDVEHYAQESLLYTQWPYETLMIIDLLLFITFETA